jgi:hypothetical protein
VSQPRIADGDPLIGELIVVVDESSPPNTGGGIAYVVTAAAMLSRPMVEAGLSELFQLGRIRPFHWASEGPEARHRMLDLIIESGVVAVAEYAHVARKGQRSARRAMLGPVTGWAGVQGATHVVIEASDAATMGRDRSTILDHHRETGGAAFAYDWRSKKEQLLWVADAIAGAVGEHVTDQNTEWFARLDGANAIELIRRAI